MAYYRRYQNYTPVTKFMSPDHITNFCTKEEGEKLIKYLEAYSGNFQPLIDTKNRFLSQQGYKYSGLSEKQWNMVRNSMVRDTRANTVFSPVNVYPAMPIVIDKGCAFKHFKEVLKLKYAVFTLKVVRVSNVALSRNGKHRKLTIEVVPNTDGTVNVCRMCGKSLTDHKSVVSGVGPYCAKQLGAGIYHTYKTDIQKFMKEFQDELAKIGTTTIEIWEANIKEGGENLVHYIDTHQPQEPSKKDKELVGLTVSDLEWLPVDKAFVASRKKQTERIERLYNVVKANKDCYIDVFNPSTGGLVRFELLNTQEVSGSPNLADYYKPCDDSIKKSVEHLIIKH